jgi:hypothetical protein
VCQTLKVFFGKKTFLEKCYVIIGTQKLGEVKTGNWELSKLKFQTKVWTPAQFAPKVFLEKVKLSPKGLCSFCPPL